jgi:hypothetical protein
MEIKEKVNKSLNYYCYNVYSQFGEDGIIKKILDVIPNKNYWCVEFGAWDGKHLSNTRNLIENYKYSSIQIEADKKKYQELKKNYSEYNNVININTLVGFTQNNNLDIILQKTIVPIDFDFLSIDVDGNDYHIWKATNKYRPKVVCIEFNQTIPTEVRFVQEANTKINQGSSILSLVELGKTKNYELVSVLSNNAFFVDSKYFNYFNISDNRPQTLRTDLGSISYIFTGYDGTVFLRGNMYLPWHKKVIMRESKIQFLPKILRKYTPHYTTIEKCLYYCLGIWSYLSVIKIKTYIKINYPKSYGFYLYYFYKELRNTHNGPFNNQDKRKDIFNELNKLFNPGKLIETGTFRGNTSEYMAKQTEKKVYTSETNKLSFGFSYARFLFNKKVKVYNTDSRIFLKQIIQKFSNQKLFFYLDAHWEKDLPLKDEVQIIFSHSNPCIVMIDDFKVPNDDGYRYDDYGPGKVLNLDYLENVIKKYDIKMYFPIEESQNETGKKRGSVILFSNNIDRDILSKLKTLREYKL